MVSTLMQPDHRPSLEEIFHAAIERASVSERHAYLDGACAGDEALRERAEALLAAHEEAGGFLEEPLVEPAAEPSLGAEPGTSIGPYRILQEIGEGGMGVVYMAEQEHPVRRKVALKIIKAGMDTKQVIARFEAERQALALMEHPNIARVLDAGATEAGRPFFVMELVRGVAINEYCDKHQMGTAERLRLFMDTCQAVQHAHHKGVIHRDIKPGNVLVTSHDGTPVVKIIDFGVAKATNQRLTEKTLFTEFRQFVGTPEYMSPEQAEMSGLDVDTRTDIYSLGVLLYQLLTGSTPFDPKVLRTAGYGEMTRMIREDEPHAPSTRISKSGDRLDELAKLHASEPGSLVKLMRGDLDWIVMQAIAKDRTRRYDSAAALADDVARHLRDEPVLAGPPSTLYRASKLFRRHRTMVGAIALACVGLLVGAGLALSGYFKAKAEAERSNKISSTLTEMLGVTGNQDPSDLDVAALLQTSREVFGSDHATVAATLSALGGQLADAGDHAGAEVLYEEAVDTYRTAFGSDHTKVGETYARLGTAQGMMGAIEKAETSLLEALRIEALSSTGPKQYGRLARRELASIYERSGRLEESLRLLREVLVALRADPVERRYDIFTVTEQILNVQIQTQGHDDLLPVYDEFVAAAEAAFPPGHLVPIVSKFGRAIYLARGSRNVEAYPALKEVLEEMRGMESPPALYLSVTLDALFQLTRERTDPILRAESDDYLVEFLEIAPVMWGEDSSMMAENYKAAAVRLSQSGRWVETLEIVTAYYAYAQRNFSPQKQLEIAKDISQAVWEVTRRRDAKKEDLIRALELLDEFPLEGSFGLRVEVLQAVALFRLGDEEILEETLTLAREAVDPADRATLNLINDAGRLLP